MNPAKVRKGPLQPKLEGASFNVVPGEEGTVKQASETKKREKSSVLGNVVCQRGECHYDCYSCWVSAFTFASRGRYCTSMYRNRKILIVYVGFAVRSVASPFYGNACECKVLYDWEMSSCTFTCLAENFLCTGSSHRRVQRCNFFRIRNRIC